jgi:hypothetical protein
VYYNVEIVENESCALVLSGFPATLCGLQETVFQTNAEEQLSITN